MKTGIIVCDVVSIETLNNTLAGNPRFSVTFKQDGEEVTRITSSDTSCSWDFSSNIRPGDTVAITVTRAGRIMTAQIVKRIPRHNER